MSDQSAQVDERGTQNTTSADGPESDFEAPVEQHIEELAWRLMGVIGIIAIVTLMVLPFGDAIINFLWDTHMPNPQQNPPQVYTPLALLLTKITIGSLAGLVIGLPVAVHQAYAFTAPGLYNHERRYFLASIPASLVLGLVGLLFAHFLMIPILFSYFTGYTEQAAELAFSLQHTFGFILSLLGYSVVMFQLPLLVILAVIMGMVSRQWLKQKRLIFWGLFLTLAFLSAPDPTGLAPFIIGLTLVALFEGTLLLLKWVNFPKREARVA